MIWTLNFDHVKKLIQYNLSLRHDTTVTIFVNCSKVQKLKPSKVIEIFLTS